MWILHQERMIDMGLFGKGNILNMTHHEGLPGYSDKTAITMELDEEHRCLIFKARAFKKPEIKLPLSKVISSGNVNIAEIEQQSKVGRAIVGGLLFGNAGAIVGAMTAGEKQKIKTLYIINYEGEAGTKAIVLHDNGSNMNFFKFQKKLQEYLPKQQAKEQPKEIVL